MCSADTHEIWSFRANVLLSNNHVTTVEEATLYWRNHFHIENKFDHVLAWAPYQYMGLGWVCSVGFLVKEYPTTWLRRLRKHEGVLSAAIDNMYGPIESRTMPEGGLSLGQFFKERWPSVGDVSF